MTDTKTKNDPIKTAKDMAPKNMQPNEMMDKAKETINKTGGKGGAAMMGTAAGAVIGAAVGGIAGRALTDETTRENLKKFADTAVDKVDQLTEKAVKLSEQTSEAADQMAGDMREMQKKTERTN